MTVATIAEGPRLMFHIGLLPNDWGSKPGFCTSLQSLDAAWLLIGARRYPQALICCASAVDSALGETVLSMSDPQFDKALAVRAHRDVVVRQGHGRGVDATCARVTLELAWPVLEALYRRNYGYDVREDLFPSLRKHLEIAERVLPALDDDDCATIAWHGFAHAVRWSLDDDLLTPADFDGRENSDGGPHALVSPGDCTMSCPICNTPQNCYLDYESEDDPVFWVNRMQCDVCGFALSPTERVLSRALFESELRQRRTEFLAGFGFPVSLVHDVTAPGIN